MPLNMGFIKLPKILGKLFFGSNFFTLSLAALIVGVLLMGSLWMHRTTNQNLVEGESPAPQGSSVNLEVTPLPSSSLVVGKEVNFKFKVSFFLNADHGKVTLILKPTPNECSWRSITSEVERGNGVALTGVSLGYERLPYTDRIQFTALLASDNKKETSTKSIVVLPVERLNMPLEKSTSSRGYFGCHA